MCVLNFTKLEPDTIRTGKPEIHCDNSHYTSHYVTTPLLSSVLGSILLDMLFFATVLPFCKWSIKFYKCLSLDCRLESTTYPFNREALSSRDRMRCLHSITNASKAYWQESSCSCMPPVPPLVRCNRSLSPSSHTWAKRSSPSITSSTAV